MAPTGRSHGAPLSGMTAPHAGHHHPGGPGAAVAAAANTAVVHPMTMAQQQQQREREKRELEREREREKQRDLEQQREREWEQQRENEQLAAAVRLHFRDTRDHVAAQQGAAYFAATAPPSQQVRCPLLLATFIDSPFSYPRTKARIIHTIRNV